MSRKTLLLLFLIGIILLAANPANSAVYTLIPPSPVMLNLNHYNYFTWGIEWNHPNERIVNAILTYHDVSMNDFYTEGEPFPSFPSSDLLYTRLLDNPPVGMRGHHITDDFINQGIPVDEWQDQAGGPFSHFDLTYDFGELGLVGALNDYASDGLFGFGISPEHLGGVELTVITTPEPTTILLFGIGLVGAGVVYRRRK